MTEADTDQDSGTEPDPLPGGQFRPDGGPAEALRSRADALDPEESIAEVMLGDGPRFTAAEVSAETGVDPRRARRMWRALGLPEFGDDRAFTADDIDALQLAMMMVDNGLIDFDTAVAVVRAMGQTMSRLADWEVGTLLQSIEQRLPEGATESRRAAGRELIEDLGEPFERLLMFAWRRHAAAAIARLEALDASQTDPETHPITIGFADIVSFTRLSNEIGRERIGDLVELFESRCSDVVAAHGGRTVKSIGDSVLFVNDDPVAALDTAEGIIKVIGRDRRMPDVRVGLATGPVVLRMGDVFGPAVNLAARLTAVARRNRIIVDARTADLLPEDQFETRRLPARPLHGFGDVEPLTVWRH